MSAVNGVYRPPRVRPFATAGRPAGPVPMPPPDRALVSKAALLSERAARISEDRVARAAAARHKREQMRTMREQFFVS
eukprot:CAMPEP_0174855226 /NCGR_PEP_ID=MMETSP1114-20130205/32764_1 /TAXON_ID=312471 /ORGANISM="Neobodo designis, Strain CCAP 1951/1" /LENGTH=77 /DNA_ID=CAMNT_0016089961 /DNA_START=41 /DNA_END=271 /DNA_ORIENTATION=+